jgi:hypothetical protein
VHTNVCEFFGLKWVYMVLMLAVAGVHVLLSYVSNGIDFLFMFVPIALASVAFLSIPQARISLLVSTERLGPPHKLLLVFSLF